MVKDKPKKQPETKLTKEELQTIINLLFSGKFGLSAQESNQAINPLVNKLSKMIDEIK